MKLSLTRVRQAAGAHGWSISRLLRKAGVSRTAFYSLLRKPSVLPRSIGLLARTLGVDEGDLVEPATDRIDEARRILKAHPEVAFDNVWHTLILLDLPPLERLERSLLRGRAIDLHP